MMMNGGSFSFRSRDNWQQEERTSSYGENTDSLLYSELTPSPLRSRTTRTLDYDEINEIDRGRFQIAQQPSPRIHTTNPVYLARGNENFIHPTLNLNDQCKFSKYREQKRNSRQGQGGERCAFLFVGFVALTTALLSAASISACLLIVFGIVSPPAMVSATENVSSSSCLCNNDEQLQLSNHEFVDLQQQLTNLQTKIELMRLKIPISDVAAQQRVKELLLEIEANNKTVEEISATTQTPRVPETSGLALPTQIRINMTNGCIQSTTSNPINQYQLHVGDFPYLNQTHVITDITCEVETNGIQPVYGEGVIEILPGTASKNISVFQYLSEVKVYCTCFYWGPDQQTGTEPNVFCRRVITRCPYEKQLVNTTLVTA